MSIVTKTGDKGTTGLFGGKRVSKADLRLHAYGTVDELNAVLGLVIAEGVSDDVRTGIETIQHGLFRLGADLATPLDGPLKGKRIEVEHVTVLEAWVGKLEAALPELQTFILPSGSKAGSMLHLARTVCRRAERWTVALKECEPTNEQAVIYLNRLSDLLFLLARSVNKEGGVPETAVHYE